MKTVNTPPAESRFTPEQLQEMGLIRFRDTNGDARWQYRCGNSWARATSKADAVDYAFRHLPPSAPPANQHCSRCGDSVAPGSGKFVNRVPDCNDDPRGDFVCAECDEAGDARTSSTDAAGNRRYRVFLTEKLHYTVDVLAKDADEARAIALEDETPRSEAECTFFDAEEFAVVPEDDKTFLPCNGCYRCGIRTDGEPYPHCPTCIEKIKAEAR